MGRRLGRVVSVTRPAQIGGTITSTLRQADAEFLMGRRIEVWSLLQKQKERFSALASQFSVQAEQISNKQLLARLALGRVGIGRIGMLHLHSGRVQASEKLKLFRQLLGRRTPLIVSLHGPSGSETQIDDQWLEHHRRYCAFATAIVVPSQMEREVQIGFGIEPDRVFVVPDIILPRTGMRGQLRSQLGLADDTPLVGFVGRIVPQKDPRTLLRAFRRVLSQRPDAVLAVGGDGQHLNLCRELAGELELGDSVKFLGHIDQPGVIYSDVDVFAAPSVYESFGITAMEAALSRVPMALTRISPWTELFEHRRHCVFADPGDEEGLALAIGELLDDRDAARRMAEAAEVFVGATFSDEASIDALDRVYRYALAQHGK